MTIAVYLIYLKILLFSTSQKHFQCYDHASIPDHIVIPVAPYPC